MARQKQTKEYKKKRIKLAKQLVRDKYGQEVFGIIKKKYAKYRDKGDIQTEVYQFLLDQGFPYREIASVAGKTHEAIRHSILEAKKLEPIESDSSGEFIHPVTSAYSAPPLSTPRYRFDGQTKEDLSENVRENKEKSPSERLAQSISDTDKTLYGSVFPSLYKAREYVSAFAKASVDEPAFAMATAGEIVDEEEEEPIEDKGITNSQPATVNSLNPGEEIPAAAEELVRVSVAEPDSSIILGKQNAENKGSSHLPAGEAGRLEPTKPPSPKAKDGQGGLGPTEGPTDAITSPQRLDRQWAVAPPKTNSEPVEELSHEKLSSIPISVISDNIDNKGINTGIGSKPDPLVIRPKRAYLPLVFSTAGVALLLFLLGFAALNNMIPGVEKILQDQGNQGGQLSQESVSGGEKPIIEEKKTVAETTTTQTETSEKNVGEDQVERAHIVLEVVGGQGNENSQNNRNDSKKGVKVSESNGTTGEQITNVTNNPIAYNGSEITDNYIADDITAIKYLPLSGGSMSGNISLGSNSITTSNNGLVSNLNADLLDGQEGSYYLNTKTEFGGDISGTYKNIAVADNSHLHTATTLPSSTSYLGSNIESGEIANNTILGEDLSSNNSASDGQVLTYNNATGGFTWADSAGVGTGTVTSVATGNGLAGGPIIASGTISINAPTCFGTDKLQWSGTDFVCSADVNTGTTYTAGNGLQLAAGEFSVKLDGGTLALGAGGLKVADNYDDNFLTTTTAFGGDVSGTYGAIAVADDSHSHTAATLPAHDSLTGAGTVDTALEVQGVAVGGDTSGTVGNIAVADDSHAHTTTTISGLDISADTNLAGDTEIVLTDDTLSIASSITRDSEWDTVAKIETATGTDIITSAENNDGLVGTKSVNETGIATGKVLKYNAVSGQWEIGDDSGGTSYTAGDGLDLVAGEFSTDLLSTGGLAITATELGIKLDGATLSLGADGIKLSDSYAGQGTITTVGTITSGTWNGTAIDDAHVANDITASNYLPLAGGTMTGAITFSGVATDITSVSNQDIVLSPNGTGKVGIGNGSPGYLLDVGGDLNIADASEYRIGGTQVLSKGNGSLTGNLIVGDGGGSITNTAGIEGYYNTAIGLSALTANTTGNFNSALGYRSLTANTTGYHNTAMGFDSLYSNTTGSFNIAIGLDSLYSNTIGTINTAIGYQGGFYSQIGSGNLFLGYQAGYGLAAYTGADYNTIIGYQAGYQLGSNQDYNVFIGYQAGLSETGSNKLYIDNSDTSTPLIYGDFSTNALTVNGTLTSTGTLTLNDNDGVSNDVNLILGDANETGQIVFYDGSSNTGTLAVDSLSSDAVYTFSGATGTVWTSGNDGSGSTLDADTLDGHDTAYFMTAGADNWVDTGGDTMTGNLTFSGAQTIYGGTAANDGITIEGTSDSTRTTSYVILQPNGGNVGIGTNNPSQELELNGDVLSKYSNYTGDLFSFPTVGVSNTHVSTGINDYSFSSFVMYGNNQAVRGEFFADGSGYFNGGTPDIYFRVATNHPMLFGTNLTERMRIAEAGNIGINTTGPDRRLDVLDSFYPQLRLTYTNESIYTDLQTDASGYLYVNASGNRVGIENNAPGYTLDVGGDTNIADASEYRIGGTQVLSKGNGSLTGNIIVGDGGGNLTHGSASEGYYNTAVGLAAFSSDSTGYMNSALGYSALNHNTTGYSNTAVGAYALSGNYIGYRNSAFGASALWLNDGDENSAFGNAALLQNTSGDSNSALGYSALNRNTTGSFNTAVGLDSGYYNQTGDHNTTVGYISGQGAENNSYNDNTFLGSLTGYATTIGSNNLFAGSGAGWANTTGASNIFLGYQAGYLNLTGADNVFMGYRAGWTNSTGSANVFLGYQAGYSETGSNKLYIDNSNTASPLIYGDFDTNALTVNGTLTSTGTLTVNDNDGVSNDVNLTLGDANETGQIVFYDGSSNTGTLAVDSLSSDAVYTFSGATGTVWTSGNDGSGSTLDADTLDGHDSSYFTIDYAQTLVVAKSGGDYTTVQAAIDSISDAASDKRYLIRVMPGLYTEQITMKSWVDIRGAGKHATQLYYTGNNNGTVILASYTQIEDVLIEGSNTGTEWGIIGSNTSQVHIRNVDLLSSGSNISQGIKITGDSWAILFIEHCVLNYLGTTGYGIYLAGNSTTPQNIDTHIVDTFVDSFNATSGGSVYVKDTTAGRMRTSLLRTSAAGFDLSLNDTSAGTSDFLLESTSMEYGASSIEVDAGATALFKESSVDTIANSGSVKSWGAGVSTGEDFFVTGDIGIGTSSPGAKLDVVATGDGTAVLKLDTERAWTFYQRSTGATAALDLQSSGNNKSFYITNAGNERLIELFAGTAADSNNTIGFMENRIWMTDGGSLGINTTGPDRKLDVLDASNPQLRLTYTDNTVYTDLQTDSSGNLNITTSGGDLLLTNAATELKIKESTGNTYYGILDVTDLSADRTYTLPNVSGTVVTTGDTGSVTGTMIANDTVALTTDTSGNYVANVANGSGITGGSAGSEGASLTLALGDLTADWNQNGAFDVVLQNASSELKIKESTGDTYYGIFDVGDLSATATYTFSGTSGTVYTSANDPYDTAGEIQGVSLGGALGGTIGSATIGSNAVELNTNTTGNYVASVTNGNGISGGNGGSEAAALTLALGALTSDWVQSGAYDISLANAGSELKIMESTGDTYYATLDVGDLADNATYTFVGPSGNVVTTTTEATFTGDARHARKIQLNAEYAGSTLSKFYGTGTDTSTTGTMTSDAEPAADLLRTYYNWTSSEASLNYYTVAVRVTLPQDFDSWATSNAVQVDLDTNTTSAADNVLDIYLYNGDDTPGTAVASSTGNKSGTADTWTTATIDDSAIDDNSAPDWDAGGETAVIYLRIGAKDSNFTRIGDIKLNYLSKW